MKFTEEYVTQMAHSFARIWAKESPRWTGGDDIDMVWIEEDDRYSEFMREWKQETGSYPWETDGPVYLTFRRILYSDGRQLMKKRNKK
jgi:hypothetical protein